ncbi:WecB/TagA/CpsF family glycosyltransferase [bacterium]|nr:WecB/TagA/CpsF family glycosyltransferase [bacterium]
MTRINILGTEINKINYKQTLSKIEEFLSDQKQHYIVTPNPEIILKAGRDINYRGILNNADLSLPDGFGLILGSWLLGDPLYHRVTGVDLTYQIAELANQKGYKLFLLGGQNNSTQIAKTKLELKFKNIKIVGVEEGFKDIKNISSTENQKIIEKIKNSEADILFVAYGAPFQEKWIYKNLRKIPNIKLAIGIGGTFDFISGKITRAPKLMRKIGLEWLWRWFLEPQRASRIFDATIKYSYDLVKWKMHTLKPFRKNALGIIINNENKLLLFNRKKDHNHWQFPQGGIEKNETPEQAVLRELKEETGLKNLKIIGKIDEIYKYYFPIHWPDYVPQNVITYNNKWCGQEQIIFFLKQTKNETPKPIDEHEDHKWVNKNELLETIHPIRIAQTKLILKHIDKYLISNKVTS